MKAITVRLSPELHQALMGAAHDRYTSMNQLCVALLENVRTLPAPTKPQPAEPAKEPA